VRQSDLSGKFMWELSLPPFSNWAQWLCTYKYLIQGVIDG